MLNNKENVLRNVRDLLMVVTLLSLFTVLFIHSIILVTILRILACAIVIAQMVINTCLKRKELVILDAILLAILVFIIVTTLCWNL